MLSKIKSSRASLLCITLGSMLGACAAPSSGSENEALDADELGDVTLLDDQGASDSGKNPSVILKPLATGLHVWSEACVPVRDGSRTLGVMFTFSAREVALEGSGWTTTPGLARIAVSDSVECANSEKLLDTHEAVYVYHEGQFFTEVQGHQITIDENTGEVHIVWAPNNQRFEAAESDFVGSSRRGYGLAAADVSKKIWNALDVDSAYGAGIKPFSWPWQNDLGQWFWLEAFNSDLPIGSTLWVRQVETEHLMIRCTALNDAHKLRPWLGRSCDMSIVGSLVAGQGAAGNQQRRGAQAVINGEEAQTIFDSLKGGSSRRGFEQGDTSLVCERNASNQSIQCVANVGMR